MAGHARHIGYVDADERYALYANASVVVVPSFEEGFGLTALEAMTTGVPVVASNRGSLPEVVGDAGTLVEPGDAEALASALDRMTSDREAARDAARRGIERARSFSWEESARILRQAYCDAIAARIRR